MNLSELPSGEENPAYRQLEASNGIRHYHFLESMIVAAVTTKKTWLSHDLITAINFHAIVGLHSEAGRYRSSNVVVMTEGRVDYTPPEYYRVPALMDECVNDINSRWQSEPPTYLAADALWRINKIHPFVNGNGRTARAVCYFILCVRSGKTILPELIKGEESYYKALKDADSGDIRPLISLLQEKLIQQLDTQG